jgi:hypothetical protein
MKHRSLEGAASKLLALYGVKAIWDIHLAAAAASGRGEPELAASLINVAEAAEGQINARHAAPLARYSLALLTLPSPLPLPDGAVDPGLNQSFRLIDPRNEARVDPRQRTAYPVGACGRTM